MSLPTDGTVFGWNGSLPGNTYFKQQVTSTTDVILVIVPLCRVLPPRLRCVDPTPCSCISAQASLQHDSSSVITHIIPCGLLFVMGCLRKRKSQTYLNENDEKALHPGKDGGESEDDSTPSSQQKINFGSWRGFSPKKIRERMQMTPEPPGEG